MIRDRYLAKFIVIVLVVVAIIASVGWVGYAETRDAVEEDTEDQLQSTATLQANSISDWTDTKKQQARQVSRNAGRGEEGVQRYLDTHWQRYNVRGIHYIDLETNTINASTTRVVVDSSLDDMEDPWTDPDRYEQLNGSDDVLVGERAYEDELFRDDVVTFASRDFAHENRVYVVVAGIEGQLESLYQPSTQQTTTIVDRDGEQVLGNESNNSAARQEVFDQERNLDNASVAHGDEFVYAYAPVDGTNWIAVSTIPRSEAFAVSDTVAENLGIVVSVSLVALLAAALVLARHTVTPLSRLRSKVDRMEGGDLSVDLSTRRSDEIGRLYGGFATMRDSLRERIEEVQEARDEAQWRSEHLEAKADEYNEVIDEWAEGDLTERLEPDGENAAMRAIAERLNEMVADMELAIDDVKQFANETAAASEQVTASTEEVQSASQQVTESIQEISEGADRQNENLLEASREMNTLSSTTQEISSLSMEVADLSERTAETGHEGRDAASEAIGAMAEIESEAERAVEEIRRLEEEEVDQIDDLITVISEIAEQTNMLALNANIEASRSASGDEGEGFGVVAAEIKDLSQDVKEAAQAIEAQLESIREQTRRSADEVEGTRDLIDDASERVEVAAENLERIAEYAERTNTGVQEIDEVTDEQASSTQGVVMTVEEVTAISQETTAEAETVASAAEEQTASLAETSGSMQQLSRRADRLREALDRFDTEVGGDVDAVEPETT